MYGNCPQCRTRLEFANSGRYECERCRLRFDVALGSPTPPAGAWNPLAALGTTPALDPELDAPCATHPGNRAAGICERCGDFMCRLCATPAEGRVYCPRCFDLLYNRGALYFTQRQFTLPGLSLGMGIAALLCSFVPFLLCTPLISLALGGLGIGFAVRALKEYRTRPDLPGRTMVTIGLSLSAVAMVLAPSLMALMFWSFSRH